MAFEIELQAEMGSHRSINSAEASFPDSASVRLAVARVHSKAPTISMFRQGFGLYETHLNATNVVQPCAALDQRSTARDLWTLENADRHRVAAQAIMPKAMRK